MSTPLLNLSVVESYINDEKFIYDGLLTICIITTTHGFKVVGTSCAFDPLKYDKMTGKSMAKNDAINKLFELVAFNLK